MTKSENLKFIKKAIPESPESPKYLSFQYSEKDSFKTLPTDELHPEIWLEPQLFGPSTSGLAPITIWVSVQVTVTQESTNVHVFAFASQVQHVVDGQGA